MTTLHDHILAATPAVQANALALAGGAMLLGAVLLAASLLLPSSPLRSAIRVLAFPLAVGAAVSAVGIWRDGIPITAFSDMAVASTGMSQDALDRAFSAFVTAASEGAGMTVGQRWLVAITGMIILPIACFSIALIGIMPGQLPTLHRSKPLKSIGIVTTAATCLGIAWFSGHMVTESALQTSPEIASLKRFENAAVYAGPLMSRLDGREFAELAARR